MAASWTPPRDYENRPVVLLGGGVLGRRIATCWASAGFDVVIRDPNQEQCNNALDYIKENVQEFSTRATTGRPVGKASAYTSLEEAVKNAWIIFEAVPEKLSIKIDTFAELERLAPEDCILASNSSSYRSGEMLEKVKDITKPRILNTHYMMPPALLVVELMTDGYTTPELLPWLAARHKEAGLSPYVAMKESTGFIFNRVWAAIKRECLMILCEGVSTPKQLDDIWREMYGSSFGPCELMDNVGLDTVAFIEDHYIHERGLPSEKTTEFLKAEYLSKGRLGKKSDKGGLYPPVEKTEPEQKLIVLNIGLGEPVKTKDPLNSGSIIEVGVDGKNSKVLLDNLPLPDGIDVSHKDGRLYWTNMGVPNKNDGSVWSSKKDGTDVKVIVEPGKVHTPKQLIIDQAAQKLYFSDREGLRVWRCNTDGSELEVIVKTADWQDKAAQAELMNWCVGVTVIPKFGKFYWTQKGFPKSNKGRIFSANIDMPKGQTAANRTDIECVLSGLPECIDLDFEEESNTLYWTDRGEVPYGNSLYRVKLDESGKIASNHEQIAQNFDETIGLKIDAKNDAIYVTDLGGSVWKCKLDGTQKKRIFEGETSSFTGITMINSQ